MTTFNSADQDFDDAFQDELSISDEVTPEPVVISKPAKEKKNGKGLKFYALCGVAFFITVFIVAVLIPADNPAEVDVIAASEVPDMQTAKTDDNSDSQNESDAVIETYQAKLKAAEQSVAIRDSKFRELANAYSELKKRYDLLKNSSQPEVYSEKPVKDDYSALPVVKGMSVISVYDSYAFLRKGQTVYAVKKGAVFNGFEIIDIDPVNRKIITTKGVIK